MTILADMTNVFTSVLLVVHVAVCLLLCLVVLMQRPKQEGLGAAFGGGMTDQAFGARTTDVLQKGTVYLGTALFIITFAISVLVGAESRDKSLSIAMDKTGDAQISQGAALLDEEEESFNDDSLTDKMNEELAPSDEEASEAPVAPEVTPAEEAAPAEEAVPAPTPAEEATSEENAAAAEADQPGSTENAESAESAEAPDAPVEAETPEEVETPESSEAPASDEDEAGQ